MKPERPFDEEKDARRAWRKLRAVGATTGSISVGRHATVHRAWIVLGEALREAYEAGRRSMGAIRG